MIYNLQSHIDNERAKKRFQQLLGKECTIELKEKKKRSLRQNAYLHLILGWFGLESGYTMNESKLIYKRQNLDIYIYEKNGQKFIRSSAELDSAEMTKSIEKFCNYSAGVAGIYLPSPQEQAFLQEIEKELNRNEFV